MFVVGASLLAAAGAASASAPVDTSTGARDPSTAGAAGTTPIGKQTADRAPPETGHLSWALQALGAGYTTVFVFLFVTLLALFVLNTLTARRDNVVPVQLIEGFESRLNEKRYQEAYDMARNNDSILGQMLSAGLAKLSSGYDKAVEAMQEVGEEENMKLEHRLSYLALIGTVAPMVGLFGTVHGMISSFAVIATMTEQPSPSELAGGISTALFTTLLGLFIAIPAIAAYNILRNRTHRLVLEVGILSEGLMSRFEKVGTRK
jgi:biopolymer transport protein ExbB